MRERGSFGLSIVISQNSALLSICLCFVCQCSYAMLPAR